jgi:hypothetical protein
MRFFLWLLGLLMLCAPSAWAERHAPASHPRGVVTETKPAEPRSIGRFFDWQAATHDEGGQPACYAFTRAVSPGRGDAAARNVILTVTQRQGGRDAVAISTGSLQLGSIEPVMDVGAAHLGFYAAEGSLFARDGHAVAATFSHTHARSATIRVPSPHGNVNLSFSLHGFEAAYAATNKACPG